MTQSQLLSDAIDLCWDDPNPFDCFNDVVLHRPPFWEVQREIGLALIDPDVRRICVQSGHMTGKDYFASGACLGWLTLIPGSGVTLIGPSYDQVRSSTWAEIKVARQGSPLLAEFGTLRDNPMSLSYGDKWKLVVRAANQPERIHGFHPKGPMLVVTGESSFLNDPMIDQAINSLKPIKRLDIFNPIRDYGEVYEACRRAADDPSIRVIKVPSTASPDAHLETSPRGLADARWIRDQATEYGRDSNIFRVRVEAEFPEGSPDLLIPADWIDRCGAAEHVRGGPIKLAMDLGLGRGGDDSTALVRDSNGMLGFESSKFRTLEESAARAKQLADHYGIAPTNISWDAAGIGADFDRRFKVVGLVGCRPFVGAARSKNPRFDNMRAAAHFAMRRRLDPYRSGPDGSPRPTFHLRRDFIARFARECRELQHEQAERGRLVLRDADEVKAALRFSPDFSVTLAQSFAFPD